MDDLATVFSITERFDDSLIFVDALCINQADTQERASQVKLMGQIYDSAETVVAWVTHPNIALESGKHFNSLERLIEVFQRIKPDSSYNLNHGACEELAETAIEASNTLSMMFDAPYWTRLWVAQEILLAHQLVFWCGRSIIRLEDLQLAIGSLEAILKLGGRFKEFTLNTARFTYDFGGEEFKFFRAWRTLKHKASSPSVDLLYPHDNLFTAFTAFSDLDCSRFHDKIYGFLGIARSQMKVDYRMDVTELYTRALVECLLEMVFAPVAPWHLLGDSKKDVEARAAVCRLLDALTDAFGLDMLDPLITTINTAALRVVGATSDPSESRRAQRVPAQICYNAVAYHLDTDGLFRTALIRSSFLARYLICEYTISWNRFTRRRIALTSKGSVSKTSAEWTEFVDVIGREWRHLMSLDQGSSDSTQRGKDRVQAIGPDA